MAVDIGSALGGMGLNLGGLGLWASILVIFFIIIVIFAILGGITVLIIWNMSYNQKITLKGRVNGKPQIIATYKGKWIKVAGEHSNAKLLFIRGIKRWENPTLLSGKNHYVFWKKEQDNSWINIIDEDVDEKMRVMKIHFTDADIRMQEKANEKLLRDRLQKKKNWMEIIAQIGYIIVFIFLIMGLVILFTQLKGLSKAMESSAQAVGEMAQAVKNSQTNSLAPVGSSTNSGVLKQVGGT